MISINVYEIIMQMVNFCILLWLMKKFLYVPMISFIESRQTSIKRDIDDAEQNRTDSETLLNEQKQLLKEARLEAKEIRSKAEAATKTERDSILTATRAEAENLVQNAKKEIELDAQRVKKELISQIGQMSVTLTEKLLNRELTDKDQDQVLNEYLAKIKS